MSWTIVRGKHRPLRSILRCPPNAFYGRWRALSHGVARFRSSVRTTALNLLLKSLSGGVGNMKLRFNLFNPIGPFRTVISKDSTACTMKPFLTPTCSLISAKSEPSPKNGSKNTKNEDPMKHYRTEHPPNGNNKFNLNLTIKPVWKSLLTIG